MPAYANRVRLNHKEPAHVHQTCIGVKEPLRGAHFEVMGIAVRSPVK